MKPLFHPSLIALLLAASLVIAPPRLHADTSSPVYDWSLYIHGDTYDWVSASEDGTFRYDEYSGPGGSVTVTGMIGFTDLASVSGAVDGHLQSGVYGDNSQSYSESGSFWANGYEFTNYDASYTYYPDVANGQLVSSGIETYSGPSGSYSSWWDDSTNDYGWSQSLSGANETPSGGSSDVSLLGTTFTWSSGEWFSNEDSSGGGISGWTDHFTSSDGGSLDISVSDDLLLAMRSTSISGWDPYAGSFSGQYEGSFSNFSELMDSVDWALRTGPSFAPAQLWVNGALVDWTWGEIGSDGVVTDHYDEGGASVIISGNLLEFAAIGATASVSVNGADGGYYDPNSGFSNDQGYDIQTSEPSGDPDPDPNPPTTTYHDSSPFFTSSTTLWVDGTEYPFEQGYYDDYGNRTDTYVNSSAGTVTLSGNTGDPNYADLSVSYYGNIDYGYYYGGDTFWTNVYLISISNEPSTDPDPDPVYGPDGWWVRGRFYVRTDSSLNDFESSTGGTLSVGDNGDGQLTISGSDAHGDFSGLYNNGPGLFMLQDETGADNVVAVPANGDGTLQLAGGSPPGDRPPAVMVFDGRIWPFLGVWDSTAYYGSTTEADQSPWLLQISMDGSGAVAYVNHATGASATGSYSSTTQLFQTSGPQSGFPMPVYGVIPNQNDSSLFGLLEAPEGLPPVFVVRGKAWRYAGRNASGVDIYQGYYNDQLMSVGAADGQGQRLVTLHDPLNNNGATTSGTLSSERKSVRLRDGTLVLSGTELGTLETVAYTSDYSLQSIPGDLDILGNSLSFGILAGNASIAGAAWWFQERDGIAILHNPVGRAQAEWAWWKAGLNQEADMQPVMHLDNGNRLNLFPTGGNSTTTAGISLDPAVNGVSTIRGVLRVRPGGDISMGEFTAGGEP